MDLVFCLCVHPKLLPWGQADPCGGEAREGCVPAGAELVEPAQYVPAGPSPHLSICQLAYKAAAASSAGI